jgi:hypothetical protein
MENPKGPNAPNEFSAQHFPSPKIATQQETTGESELYCIVSFCALPTL